MPGDLYVTSDASNQVRHYQPNGTYVNVFTSTVGASGEMAIHFGATNNRVLVGHSFNGVEEFNATTGAYIKTYNPGGGWQWAGLYGPGGVVLIGSMNTNDVRKYHPATGAFIGPLVPVYGPGDMKIGPNGNLYICSFLGGFVLEVNATTGAFVSTWAQPPNANSNDIAFLPNGDILVTCMSINKVCRYDSAHNFLGSFTGTGWGNPHGIEIHPTTGNILVDDGVTGQIHEFDPVTYTELNAAYLSPTPGDKIVDLAFAPPGIPTPAAHTTWGRIKTLYK